MDYIYSMDWIHSLLDGIAVGLSALIAGLVARKRPKKGRDFAIIFFVSSAVFTFAAELSKPSIDVWRTDRQLRSMPVYATLAEHEPQLYAEIKQKILEVLKGGKTRQEAAAEARPLVTTAVNRYTSTASDEAVEMMVRVAIRQIEALEKDGSDKCYRLLFPQQGEPLLLSSDFPPQLAQEELNAMAEIISTGAAQSGQPMSPEDAQPLIEQLINSLIEEHGDAVVVLAETQEPDVDRRMVCRMTAHYLEKTLSLPVEQRGPLLRYAFGQAGK